MKVYLCYDFKNNGWGGGNQFLKALKKSLKKLGHITDSPEDSDIILFNAHQEAQKVISLKIKYPNKLFVQRMDGLYKLYNHKGDDRQDISIRLNQKIADATIFQNHWSRNEYLKSGLKDSGLYAVIGNAPDKDIFHSNYNKTNSSVIRLVCTSWSINKNKGFKYYQHLDNNLDFKKYSFTYIGKNPEIKFKNIKKTGPFNSQTLAKKLREYDIFVTGSKYECCSNSLLEALSSGLPAIGLNSGGTPEIIKSAGELFNSKEDIISSIDKVSSDIENYRSKIDIKNINDISEEYILFFQKLINE